jgi:hypothetical protein
VRYVAAKGQMENEQPVTVLENTTEPIQFDERQQQLLDSVIIPKAMGRAAKDVRAELAATKEKLAIAEAALKAQSPNSTETERLKAELELARAESASVKAAAAEATRVADIERLATKHGVIDAPLLRAAIGDRVQRQADGSYTILDDTGTPRDGVTLDQFINEQAEARPYLVRGQVIPGAGGQGSNASVSQISSAIPLESIFGPKSDARLANQLAIRDNKKYQQLKVLARQKGLVS